MTSRVKDSPVVPFAQAAPEDALRTMLTTLMHETLEREFATFVGADRFERTPARQDVRNGYRRRRFVTRVGTLTLRIPRDRQGRFQPSLFARYQRHEQAFVLALTEMYLPGVSTRKVSGVVEQLCGTTNSIEHDHMAVRRRTRVIRIFPNEASLVRLLSALAIERNEQWMTRRYLRPTFDELVTEEQAQAAGRRRHPEGNYTQSCT